MAEKVACKSCGKLIIAATAKNNRGRCYGCSNAPKTKDAVLRSDMLMSLAAAIGFVALGLIAFFWFRHLETEGGSVRVNVLVVLLYETLGPLGSMGFFFLAATVAGWRAEMRRRALAQFLGRR